MMVQFLAWFNPHLNEKAHVMTVWARGDTFINETVDEREVWATIFKRQSACSWRV